MTVPARSLFSPSPKLVPSLAAILILGGGAALLPLRAQETSPRVKAPAKGTDAPKDYSQEGSLFETFSVAFRFEKDGTGRRVQKVRQRLQSEAGVARSGQLVFGYASANERLDIDYIRVVKADGSVVATGADAVQDLAIAVEQSAPEYTDYRQKHVTVQGLRPGDVLEYQITTVFLAPLAPGQFWGAYDFWESEICLDERLELDVPLEAALKLKFNPAHAPAQTDAGGRRTYRWTHAQLKRAEDREAEAKEKKAAKGRKKEKDWKGPDVSFTTFQSWADVGRWYAGLERVRRQATPALRAKVAALTQGLTSDLAKIEAVYAFVAQGNRYVSLSFGTGRYQPHDATQTLENQYGDCKDKHTLLAALLQAAGYKVNTVLIHDGLKLDPEQPSPAQFNHVITQVELGAERLWMDTTAEAAPFRLLVPRLRHKLALVVAQDGPSRLEETPLAPPFPCFERTELEGTVDSAGALKATLKSELRGDSELGLRIFLRRTPESQWKQALKGAVGSQMRASGLEEFDYRFAGAAEVRQPLALDVSFKAPRFLVLADKEGVLELPVERMNLAQFADEDEERDPILFGGETEFRHRAKLTLPVGVALRAPLGVDLVRDFAEYHATYRVEGQRLELERRLSLKVREVPYDRKDEWNAFRRTVVADQQQTLGLRSETPIGTPAEADGKDGEKDLDKVLERAVEAHKAQAFAKAAALYEQALKLDPEHKDARQNLGRCYLALREYAKALKVFEAVAKEAPYDEWASHLMGVCQWRLGNLDEAVRLLKKQLEISPLHPVAHSVLASVYMDQRNWKAALPELEKSASIAPKEPGILTELGRVQLNLGQDTQALATFERALEMSSTPMVWNNIAYQLSEKKLHLDRAQQYAESAVSATVAGLRNLNLGTKQQDQQRLVSSLASYWDTLGWIHFQRGDLDKAELYILPAWELSLHGEVGDHLAQIAEKRGDVAKAQRLFAQAAAAGRPVPESREKLLRALGDGKKVDRAVEKGATELLAARTIVLDAKGAADATGECYLSFQAGPVVEDVVFTAGSEAFKPYEAAIRAAKPAFSLPKALNARVVRRALIRTRKGGACELVFFPSDASAGDSTSLQ